MKTCEYLELAKQCGKEANQEAYGEEWDQWIPVCDYHAAISKHWGFSVRVIVTPELLADQ